MLERHLRTESGKEGTDGGRVDPQASKGGEMGNCFGSPAGAANNAIAMQKQPGGKQKSPFVERGSVIRKAKAKRVAIAAEAIANEADVVINQVEKSRDQLRLINNAISNNLLFEHLPGSVRTALVASMTDKAIPEGTDIIVQGDEKAEEFYVLEKGNASVYVDHECVLKYPPGSSFGELALMYNAPRAATVKADVACSLWVMDRKVYTAIKRTYDKKVQDKIKLMSTVPMLELLSDEQKALVADALEQKDYEEGEAVMEKGEIGDMFYMIHEGTVRVVDGYDELAKLKAGDHFGERALLKDDVRAASVVAETFTRCYALNRSAFTQLLGPLESVWNYAALKSIPILESLSDSQKKKLAAALRKAKFEAGEFVFHKGDQGESFFIVESGSFVILDDATELATLRKGGCFGELALIKSDTRAASVQALESATCLTLDRSNFEELLGSLQKIQNMWRYEALRKVPILSTLTPDQRWKLATAIKSSQYNDGEFIIKEGENGDTFFIMECGSVGVYDGSVQINTMGSGNYFGEMALLHNDVRKKSVKALNKVSVLSLSRNEFKSHLGDLAVIMKNQVTAYDAMAVSKLSNDVKLKDLKHIAVLGMGAFGKVILVKYKDKRYALKCLKKAQIVTMGLTEHIKREKTIMMECHSPFLVNLAARFKDDTTVYLLMECVMGGELFTYLQNRATPLSEHDAKFYTACVIKSFEYLQDRNFVYRDLKPDNLLIDSNGYLKLADFGFAKRVKPGLKTYTMCGTPDYLAPELVQQSGHTKAVDWWALGVLIFEMVNGTPPFYDDDQVVLFRNIVNVKFQFPPDFSKECRDLIRNLLQKNPAKRLGSLNGGVQDIKDHPWFTGFDWDSLNARTMKAPYQPSLRNEDDVSNFEDIPLSEAHPGDNHSRNYRSIGRFKDW